MTSTAVVDQTPGPAGDVALVVGPLGPFFVNRAQLRPEVGRDAPASRTTSGKESRMRTLIQILLFAAAGALLAIAVVRME